MNWALRIAQWIIALHKAKHRIPLVGMFKAILSGPVPRKVWRERLRYGCYECVLFNKELLTCRGAMKPYDQWGCDCFLPFKAMSAEPHKGGCYGRETFKGDFGWGAYVWPSRWARIMAPIRFILRK
jgi:hypothetical protein